MSVSVISRNNVRVSGHGTQPMVFAPSLGCDQTMWRFVAPAFESTHRVVLFDFVGSGQSDAGAYDPTRYATLQGYASDVLEILEALELHHAVFVGHSVSATVGMLASLRRPSRFSRLVHIGASPSYLSDPPHYHGSFDPPAINDLLDLMEQDYTGWARTLASMIVGSANSREHASELEASLCATDPAIARHFAEATFLSDHRHDVHHVSVPSLIVQCAQDAIAPEPVGRWLSRHLPNSTYHALEATGHCPQITHPGETIRAIRDWLAAPAAGELALIG